MKDSSDKKRHVPRYLKMAGIAVAILAALWAGYVLRGSSTSAPSGSGHVHVEDEIEPKEQTWTCSMHPQIRQKEPGQCPICGMDLIPVESTAAAAAGPREFVTSEGAKALMNVETAEVVRMFVTKEVRMVGKIDYDETRLGYITAWVPGRIDRMYVDYTGIHVNKGDHMVYLYSPDLLVAQDELRRASRAMAEMPANAPETLRRTAEATRNAAREKLRRWGLANAQIEDAEKRGITSDHVTIYAPMGGTVIHREGQEGMYVNEGTRLYTIADLEHLWLKLDAYESDLPWLHYGQKASFTTEAYPGEEFEGRISFIDPIVSKTTRTVDVRLVVPNPDGRLKPEMFVRAVVRAQIATGGRVMDPDMAGKWICPMHPEIVKEGSGSCDICGMALVKAEELGYVAADPEKADRPLVIPASAPLITGTRAVVYVEVPDRDKPTYEGREIVLGPRAGDFYLVRSGLSEGERVVVRGNFKIDSALQIQAKPSMMLPESEVEASQQEHDAMDHEMLGHEAPDAFRTQLRALYNAYTQFTAALAGDDLETARASLSEIRGALNSMDALTIPKDQRDTWSSAEAAIEDALDAMEKASDIEGLRRNLVPITAGLAEAIRVYGIAEGPPVYRAHCPMAFDNKGADWLQPDTAIRNPYFGSMMLECGEITGRLDGTHEEAPHE